MEEWRLGGGGGGGEERGSRNANDLITLSYLR